MTQPQNLRLVNDSENASDLDSGAFFMCAEHIWQPVGAVKLLRHAPQYALKCTLLRWMEFIGLCERWYSQRIDDEDQRFLIAVNMNVTHLCTSNLLRGPYKCQTVEPILSRLNFSSRTPSAVSWGTFVELPISQGPFFSMLKG